MRTCGDRDLFRSFGGPPLCHEDAVAVAAGVPGSDEAVYSPVRDDLGAEPPAAYAPFERAELEQASVARVVIGVAAHATLIHRWSAAQCEQEPGALVSDGVVFRPQPPMHGAASGHCACLRP